MNINVFSGGLSRWLSSLHHWGTYDRLANRNQGSQRSEIRIMLLLLRFAGEAPDDRPDALGEASAARGNRAAVEESRGYGTGEYGRVIR